MARHIIQLEFPKTTNKGIFLIRDTSIYASSIPVNCAAIEILPPGYNTPSVIQVAPGFDLILNACTIGILASGCSDHCPDLPDGVYQIRYSVSPSDKLNAEYKLLRDIQFKNRLAKVMCEQGLGDFKPSAEMDFQIAELQKITYYADTAVALVEDQNKTEEGMDVFRYAISKLAKFSCSTCS